jgi:hypothetical protein
VDNVKRTQPTTVRRVAARIRRLEATLDGLRQIDLPAAVAADIGRGCLRKDIAGELGCTSEWLRQIVARRKDTAA